MKKLNITGVYRLKQIKDLLTVADIQGGGGGGGGGASREQEVPAKIVK